MQIRPLLLLTLGCLAAITPFAIDLYLPGLPEIARDLGSDIELAQLSVTVYLGVFAAAQLVLGPVSDMLGRRATIAGGLMIFALATGWAALAPGMGSLLAARAAQALGGAAVAVTVPALVRDLYERDDYARVMSLVMLVMGIAPLAAPSLGGLILEVAGWRWLFVALLVVTLAATGLFLAVLPETLPADRRHVPELGRVMRNYARVLADPAALGYLLAGALAFGGMMTFIVTSPAVYITLYGFSPSQFGVMFALNVGLAMIGTMINARVVRRVGSERLLRLGLTIQAAAGALMLALALGGIGDIWSVAGVGAVFLGLQGIVLGNSMAGFMGLFPRMAGTASALAGASRFGIGAAAGSLVSLLHDGSARPMLIGMGLCALLAWVSHRVLCCRSGRESGEGAGPERPRSRA
jgi:DHA1 family bicyclomycin/chloramphenicol resistance-like MFS transporter